MFMKKQFLKVVLIFTMLLAISTVSSAEGDIIVRIDSQPVVFTENSGAPFIDNNDRTLVPLRVTMESYGTQVEWNPDTRIATVKKDDVTVEVPLGQKYILKNGQEILIDTESVIKEDRTYLPIRAVIEAFGSEVQWDKHTKTVVITSKPFDARSLLLDAYNKTYDWKNYGMEMKMLMVMPTLDELGNIVEMQMDMDMDMTIFMAPMKIKSTAEAEIDMGPMKMKQPVMDMYMTLEDDTFTTYMGTYDEEGKVSWLKTIDENEGFKDLMDIEKSKDLNEASIKDVKYLGDYTVNGTLLQKFENTTSFEAYNDLMGSYMGMLSSSASEDMMGFEMLKNMNDIVFIVYVDKATGQVVSYEMDLSPLFISMMEALGESTEASQEEMEMLKSLKMTTIMKVKDINTAEDFEIPEEALNAKLVEDIVAEEVE
ncbi:copper amine oxidase N-terminal domain-containing protein [Tissierella creatinini]|nr:copper amine oxidase N-terminal domain-containing protein [Tissierella creatinini]TJX67393.1 copper amine oxidase N-terminal domain-containing protein [Soehngenia saccharolytica]